MRAVLIPIKEPARAKQRLALILSPEEREKLVWSMWEDVARALSASRSAHQIAIATSNVRSAAYAREQGWRVIEETRQISHSHSVDRASALLKHEGFSSVLQLPADIPLLRAEDVDELISTRSDSPLAVVVPSRDGAGTNALLRHPPDAFPSRFGDQSFFLHREAAQQARVECKVIENPRIALDLDDPADLMCFYERGEQTLTLATMIEMDLPSRFREFKINAGA